MTKALAHRGRLIGGTLLALLLAIGLFLLGRWSVPFEQRPGSSAPVVAPLIANPKVGELATVVPLQAQARYRELVPVALPAVAAAFRQVLTAAPLKPGDQVISGTLLAAVNDRPVFAFNGALPSYRVMKAGDQGADVKQLLAALAELGYPSNTQGVLTADALGAVSQFLSNQGYPELAAALPTTGIDGRMFVFLTQLPATVISAPTSAGIELQPASTPLTLGAGGILLTVAPTKAEQNLPAGTPISASCGSLNLQGSSTDTRLPWMPPASSGEQSPQAGKAAVSTGWIVKTEADLTKASNQVCVATATLTQGEAKTVSVPVAALYSRNDGSQELHLQTKGMEFESLPVKPGSAAGGWVPIVDPPARLTAHTKLILGKQG